MAKRSAVAGSDNLTANVLLITPQVAKQLLKEGTRNREVRKTRIGLYSRAMQRGEWVVGQALYFDAAGRLMDGQHRLLAVIDSNTPTQFLCIYGFDHEVVFARLDGGAPRALKDWLHDQREDLPAVLAGVINMLFRHENGRVPFGSSGPAMTGPEGLEFLEKHPGLRKAVKGPGTVNRYAPRKLCCFLYYLFRQSDWALADTFFVDLVLDDEKNAEDPIYLLRSRLESNRHAKEQLRPTEMAALIIKAWNATKQNYPIKQLRWSASGKNAEYFPEVQ